MRPKEHIVSITVSTGSGTNVEYFRDEIVKGICFTPPSSTASYDVKVVNKNLTQIYHESDLSGETDVQKDSLFLGMMTITVENASVDGTYKITFLSYELPS